jgi:hypothetical protein
MKDRSKSLAGIAVGFVLVVSVVSCGRVSRHADTRASQQTPAARPSEPPALGLWDNFGVVEGHEVGRYKDLASMVRGAHAIVGAEVETVDGDTVFGAEEGPEGGALRGITVNLRVTEVYRGEKLAVGDLVRVTVGLTYLHVDVETKFAALVGDRGMFFLIPAGAAMPEFGVGPSEPLQGSGEYTPVTSQGVFINDGGTVALGTYLDNEGFPTQFEEMPFREFEEHVEAAAQEAQAS